MTDTPLTKTMYLIRRKPGTTREALVAHWFAHHMPLVIEGQTQAAAQNRVHAKRYIATLFDADASGDHPWDGVAQLWWTRRLPRPEAPFGDPPSDSFQERAEPYWPWATAEYVMMDGELDSTPLTLNAPYPTTRSGFFKVTFLVAMKDPTEADALFEHWRTVHAENVQEVMHQVGGWRYVVSHSLEPQLDPYAGMAELYFDDAEGWRAYKRTISADGMERWVDDASTLVLRAQTEMVGIP